LSEEVETGTRSPKDGQAAAERLVVVGLGASAGGLEALERFFAHLPPGPGMAFVVVQHLDPAHESLMPELLSKCTTLPVEKARHRESVAPGRIYVIPPNTLLTIVGGTLQLSTPATPRGQRSPIDVFFRSLGEDRHASAIGVILSGTGTDGTAGLRAIKESGGLTVAQEPTSAKYDSMPRSAVVAGCVDHVLPVEQIPVTVLEYARHLASLRHQEADFLAGETVQQICAAIRERTGHDFSHYERNTLIRRIRRQDFAPVAALVTAEGEILHVTGRTQRFLELTAGPFENNILPMTRRELRLPLRAVLHQASRTAEPVESADLRLEDDQGGASVRITVRPIEQRPGEPPLFLVVFAEAPAPRSSSASAPPGDDLLVQQLESELRRTKEDLQSTIEELETSNEELLSMNEELQSSNEELQTSKEELQSVNEELHTVNAELSRKVDEADCARDDILNLFQASPVATIFLDRELRVQRFTPAIANVIRLREGDVGRPVTDLHMYMEDRSWLEDAREVLRTLTPRERELRVSQGSAVAWFILRVFPHRTASNRIDGVVLSFSDVTELKRAQLRAEELAEVVASSHDAIVRQALDGRMTSWNRGAEEIFGFRAEEALGRGFERLVPSDRREELEALLRRLRAGEAVEAVETELLTRSGERAQVSLALTLTHDTEGRPSGIAAIARDDTRRKQAEAERARLARELAERAAELQTILDLAPIGLAVATDPAGARIVGNRAWEAILGMPLGADLSQDGDPAGAPPFRVFREGLEVPPAEVPIPASAPGRAAAPEALYEYRFADGRLKLVQVSSVPLLDPAGRSRGAVAAMVDVTEQRRIEAELQAAAQQRDDFITLLAHELRNPMAAIALAVEVLVRRDAVSSEGLAPLAIIQRQAAQLGRLVEELLDVSRIARRKVELHLEPLDLARVVEEAVEDQRAMAERARLVLRVNRPNTALWVNGDRARLTQVVGNLLSNAVKFTREGGEVAVSVDGGGGGEARVVVRDTGIGIAPQTLATIFEPFRRDARRAAAAHEGGLGLGLALSKGLVELHGGRIAASSDGWGTGAAFQITLPQTPAPAGKRRRDKPVPGAARRVLVVDDGEDLARLLCELLEGRGHQTGVAHDGRAALCRAREMHPDVVICDIGLPGDLDGYGVARKLRADPMLAGTYLIALTGFASDADRALSAEAGFDLHLTKPADLEELERLVAECRPIRH
jgi:two-component system CheB/CheR fusion protein